MRPDSPLWQNDRMTTAGADTRAGGALGRFFGWWGAELAAAFGPAPRAPKVPSRTVTIEDGDAVVRDGRGRETARHVLPPDDGGETPAPGRRALALKLDARTGLVRSFPLPWRAERRLDDVIGHEFGARVPFDRETVYSGHLVRARERDRILVDLAVAPKAEVDRLLRRLAAVGLRPTWAIAGDVPVNLLAEQRSVSGMARLMPGLLVILALIIAAAIAWAPVLPLMERRALLVEEEALALTRADAAMRLEARAAALRAEGARLNALTAPSGLLTLLEKLSDGLPDEIYLTDLRREAGEVRLTAIAPSATRLMEMLAELPGITGVRLASPVGAIRDGRERVAVLFSIEAGT